MKNIETSSQVIELAETNSYIELTNRLCYYDYPNGNDLILSSVDADEKAETLLNQPVVAKYVEKNNLPNFGGHEMKKDSKGNVTFGTEYIGTHTDVYIQEEKVELFSGEVVTTKCLYAKSRIWKRKQNVIKAIKRLYNLGKLFTSWEIVSLDKTQNDDGTETVNDYYFESNCILGTSSFPSFGKCATTLEIASQEENPELLIAEALAFDIEQENKLKEENILAKKNIETAEELETSVAEIEETETANCEDGNEKAETENSETEKASLTSYDLRRKIEKACGEKSKWCWVSYLFPEEKIVWVKPYDSGDLDYLKFTYEVDESDNVTVSEPEEVKLTVSVAEINTTIATKDDALASANEKINILESEISELKVFKDQVAEIERKNAEKELAEKKENLKAYAIKSKQITEAELESDKAISKMISELDEDGIKAIISDRFVASLSANKENEVEVSEVHAKADLDVDDETFDAKLIIKNFLRK